MQNTGISAFAVTFAQEWCSPIDLTSLNALFLSLDEAYNFTENWKERWKYKPTILKLYIEPKDAITAIYAGISGGTPGKVYGQITEIINVEKVADAA